MNLPNFLTVIRIALIPVFMGLALQNSFETGIAALIIFCIASITDFIDGLLARKYHLITNFGKIMDPLADKLLVISAFLIFVAQGRMHCVALMIILAREFAITSLRVVAVSQGKVLAAGMSGKIKTVSQMCYIILMLLNLSHFLFIPSPLLIEQVAMWLITAITLWSGIDYFVTNMQIIKSSIK